MTLQDLGQINLLVGGNNSGKNQCFWKQYQLIAVPLDPLEWLNTSWRREIKYSRKPQLDALKWLFPQNREVDQADLYEGGNLCFLVMALSLLENLKQFTESLKDFTS